MITKESYSRYRAGRWKWSVVLMIAVGLGNSAAHNSAYAQWTRTGGPPGQNATGDPSIFWARGYLYERSDSGLFISSDDGSHWVRSAVSDSVSGLNAICSIGNLLFVGSSGSSGPWYTSDNGETWHATGDFCCTTGVASLGTMLFASTGSTSLHVSLDSGRTWYVDSPDEAQFGGHPNLIWFVRVIGPNVLLVGDGGYRHSSDSGATWSHVTPETGRETFGTFGGLGSTILAPNYRSQTALPLGLLRSTDGGATWVSPSSDPSIVAIYTFASSGNIVFGGGDSGVFVSRDTGNTWVRGPGGLPKSVKLEFLAIGDKFVFANTVDDGVWRAPLSQFSAVHEGQQTFSSISMGVNYPNPVVTQTHLSFSNPRRQFIEVRVVDVLGKERALVFSGTLDAGDHSYDWNASQVPDGVYFCIVRSESGMVEMPLVVKH